MSSPVTGNDFVVATPGQSFCERITNLLSIGSKFKLWFDWAFDDNGNATPEFKAQFLPPPGVIWPYYKEGSEAAVKAAVEQLGRPDGDAVTTPFWRLCDGTDGTPDLRGRVIVGAGDGTGDELTNRAVGAIGGSETVTLTSAELPDLTERLEDARFKIYTSDDADASTFEPLTGDNTATWGFIGDTATGGADGDLVLSPATTKIQVSAPASPVAAEPHENMPPFLAVWYIIRTSRTE